MKHFYRSIIAAAGVLSLSVGCNEAIGCRHYRSTISSESSDSGEEIYQNLREYSDDSLTSDDEIEDPRARGFRRAAQTSDKLVHLRETAQQMDIYSENAASQRNFPSIEEFISPMYRIACFIADRSEKYKDQLKISIRKNRHLLKKTNDDSTGYDAMPDCANICEHVWKKHDKIHWVKDKYIDFWDSRIKKDNPNWLNVGCSLILNNLVESCQREQIYEFEKFDKSVYQMLKRLLRIWFLVDEPNEDDMYKMYETSELYINSGNFIGYFNWNRDEKKNGMKDEVEEKYNNFFMDCDLDARRELLQIGTLGEPEREDSTTPPFHWNVESCLAKGYNSEKLEVVYDKFCEENKNFNPLQFNGGDFVEFFNKLDNGVKSAFEEYINPLEYKRWEKGKNEDINADKNRKDAMADHKKYVKSTGGDNGGNDDGGELTPEQKATLNGLWEKFFQKSFKGDAKKALEVLENHAKVKGNAKALEHLADLATKAGYAPKVTKK